MNGMTQAEVSLMFLRARNAQETLSLRRQNASMAMILKNVAEMLPKTVILKP